MKLSEATSPEEIERAVEDQDQELLEDIRRAVGRALDVAWDEEDPLPLYSGSPGRDAVYSDYYEYSEALHESDWGDAIHDAWAIAQERMAILAGDNRRLYDRVYEQVRNELYNEVAQPTNVYENAYVSLSYEDEEDEGAEPPDGHRWYAIEPRKRHIELELTWPLSAVPDDELDEIVEDIAWDKFSADLKRAPDPRLPPGWGSVPAGTVAYRTEEPVEIEGEQWVLEIDIRSLGEYIADQAREYISDLVDKDPDAAVGLFMESLEQEDPALAKKVAKAKLPRESLASLAVSYFTDDDIGLIYEAVGQFGYKGSRGDAILSVTRSDLAAMGITSGRLWDGAPWTLWNLPPNELAYEGVRQRHCVGRLDMGYRERVEDGTIWVWSLRNVHHKPLLTWEIDRPAWERTDWPRGRPRFRKLGDEVLVAGKWVRHTENDRDYRGAAVRQLKGKLNRKAGKDPAEAAMLLWIFDRLGINEWFVRDFEPEYRRDNPRRRNSSRDALSFSRPCRA